MSVVTSGTQKQISTLVWSAKVHLGEREYIKCQMQISIRFGIVLCKNLKAFFMQWKKFLSQIRQYSNLVVITCNRKQMVDVKDINWKKYFKKSFTLILEYEQIFNFFQKFTVTFMFNRFHRLICNQFILIMKVTFLLLNWCNL